MDLKNVQKQGGDETTQEDFPTFAVYFSRCRIAFLYLFCFCLASVHFSGPSVLEVKFGSTFFPSCHLKHSSSFHLDYSVKKYGSTS